jgi:hypothetical protein
MGRARRTAVIVLAIAIPLGGVGAWAFNPDSGAVLHSEVLWRIFGIMFEAALFLLAALVVALGLLTVVRALLAAARALRA